MGTLDILHKIRHCFEVACEHNPTIRELCILTGSSVETMCLYENPLILVINPEYIINENISDGYLVGALLRIHDDYIALKYPEHLQAPSTAIPQ